MNDNNSKLGRRDFYLFSLMLKQPVLLDDVSVLTCKNKIKYQ